MECRVRPSGILLEALKDASDMYFLELQSQFLYSGEGSCKPEERPTVLTALLAVHCLTALPARSIWLFFHSIPFKRVLGELRSVPQPAPCSTPLITTQHCFILGRGGCKNIDHMYF